MEILLKMVLFLYYAHYYAVIVAKFWYNLFYKMMCFAKNIKDVQFKILPHDNTHKDVFLQTQQMIKLDGYSLQKYKCKTKDGAFIHFWRITNKNLSFVQKYPVVIMHGLLQSSASWFLQHKKQNCLPYLLAKEGYDVWVGDNRGNRISYDASQEKFQNFTLDHLIEEDQPTLINYVLQQTNKQKLIYIGHSQGSTSFILGLGINEETKAKIACFIGLGTIVSLKGVNKNNALDIISKLYAVQILNFLGFKKLIHCSKRFSRSIGVLFENSVFHKNIIMSSIKQLIGSNEKDKIPDEMLARIFTHEPGGGSSNNVIHWMQCFRSKSNLKKFDYGKNKNKILYGSQSPSQYSLDHLKELSFNSYIFRGKRDHLISDESISLLLDKFDKTKSFLFELQDYNHLDYLWSQFAPVDIYHKILHILNQN